MSGYNFGRFFKMLPPWAKALVILGYPIHLLFRWIWSWL